uniref:nectin-2-like n=1 Tax=Myxine glutinosa TaxID=7769 RepID=UPI00358FF890
MMEARPLSLALFLFLCLFGASLPAIEGLKVRTEGDVFANQGDGNVELRCSFTGIETLTQISWQRIMNELGESITKNVAVYNPQHGKSYPPSELKDRVQFRSQDPETDPSLVLFNPRSSDDGLYVCEVSTFPTGNVDAKVNLTIIVKPKLNISFIPQRLIYAAAGPLEVAKCVAAGGRPPATFAWTVPSWLKYSEKTVLTTEPDRTHTATSTLQVEDRTWRVNGMLATCHISHRAFGKPHDLSTRLEVMYPPEGVELRGYDHNWFRGRTGLLLECKAQSNPDPKFTWKMANGSLPDDARPKGAILELAGPVSEQHNGTYVCQASNGLGTRLAAVTVFILDKPQPQERKVGAVLGGIIAAVLLLVLIATIILLYCRSQRKKRTDRPLVPAGKKAFHNIPPSPDNLQMRYVEGSREEPQEGAGNVPDEGREKTALQPPYYAVGELEYADDGPEEYHKLDGTDTDPVYRAAYYGHNLDRESSDTGAYISPSVHYV